MKNQILKVKWSNLASVNAFKFKQSACNTIWRKKTLFNQIQLHDNVKMFLQFQIFEY